MPAPTRHLRVFLSSTFRDMQAERDHLARHVFPRLGKLCESRHAALTEVDLRWGITEEDAAAEGILGICLNEIDRCRPHFIGLLGDRYGSRLSADDDRSITELEILHGALQREPDDVRASFYFRTAGDVSDPDAPRLEALKQSVRGAARERRVHLRENYRSAQELGEWIFQDLSALIDELFPADAVPVTNRDAEDHDAFARSRADVYLRRADLHAALTAAVTNPSDGGIIVTGEAGVGKSALLANWAREFAEASPDTLVLTHFAGASSASADWRALLRRLTALLHGSNEVDGNVGASDAALREQFAGALRVAAARRPVVLVLDGLNHLEDRDGAPDLVWLPDRPPAGVKIVASALPSRSLDALFRRGLPQLEIGCFDAGDRLRLIRDYLGKYTKRLADAQAGRIAQQPQSGNPRFLRALLEELRLFGFHEALDVRVSYYLECRTPRDLYDRILERWDEDYGAGALVAGALSLLWASRRGLYEHDLLALLGDGESPLPHARWAPLLIAAEQSLIDRSGLLSFSNTDLRDACAARYLRDADARHAIRRRLVMHFYDPDAMGPRHREELTWQLSQDQDWEGLSILLSDGAFLVALRLDDEFQARHYWMELESHGYSMRDAYAAAIASPGTDREVALVLSELLMAGPHRDDAIRLLEGLAEHSRASGDNRMLRACLGNLAALSHKSGDLGTAARLLDEARERSPGGDDAIRAHSLVNEAQVAAAGGDKAKALRLLKEAEAMAVRIERDDILSASLGTQAMMNFAKGQFAEALAMQQRVEALARRAANPQALGASLGNQGFILRELGRLDAALTKFREAGDLFEAIGDRTETARSRFNEAQIRETRRKR